MKLLRHVQICWAGVIILKVEGKNFADDGRHACNVHSPLNFQSAFFFNFIHNQDKPLLLSCVLMKSKGGRFNFYRSKKGNMYDF